MSVQKPIKLLIVSVLSLFVTISCQNNQKASTIRPEHYMPFKVTKLAESKFEVKFSGTPNTSIEEARDEWNHKAKQLCSSDESLLDDNYSTEDMAEYFGESVEYNGGSSSGLTGGHCATGGTISCALSSVVAGMIEKNNLKEFPIISGLIHCTE